MESESKHRISVNEYIKLRERHFQRSIYEVLLISGLSVETSAKFASTMMEAHSKKWQKNEPKDITKALSATTIPFITKPNQDKKAAYSGETIAGDVFISVQANSLPDLKRSLRK